ncbi:hypothetical protein F4778DRAFT_57817 [Xylariomycetidae sp. FL2044]|nr:hypothetical protein F4778DRAFT_57817 [Xylariomycetidae sp. FL2044]
MAKQISVARKDRYVVHQHCPDRPYLELKVPEDAKSVKFVDYAVCSRDQGTANSMLCCDARLRLTSEPRLRRRRCWLVFYMVRCNCPASTQSQFTARLYGILESTWES